MSNSSSKTCDESMQRVYIPQPCVKEIRAVQSSTPWGRFRITNCDALNALIADGTVTKADLAMRRKAEVLQYKYKHQNSVYTKKGQFASAVQNNKMSPGKLRRLRTACSQKPGRIEAPASASDVPGGGILWMDRSVPYIPIGTDRRPPYSTDEGDYL